MDEELLTLWAKHRNREAADLLIRRHEQALFAFALRLTRSQTEAADAVQETCLRALQKAGEFQGRSSCRTWLFGIAVNVIRSRRFRLQRLRSIFRPLESTEHVMDENSLRKSQHEMLAKVDAALAALPQESRVPILLHYYQGFDYEQMAQILRCPPGTVASRLHVARKRLEKSLRRDGVDLAALGFLEMGALTMLREGASAPIPASLQNALRALPQKALSAPLAVPVTGKGALLAASMAAVALLGGSYFLHAQALATKTLPDWMSSPPLRAAVKPREAPGATPRTTRDHAALATNCEQRWEGEGPHRALRLRLSSMSLNPQNSSTAELFSLEVSGFVQSAETLRPEECAELSLRAVWPPHKSDAVDPFLVASARADAHGAYELKASQLAAGVYEIVVAEDSYLPRFFVLRGNLALHHDFLRLQRNEEERATMFSNYAEELSRTLENFFLEEGQSALRLHCFGAEDLQPQVFAYRGSERIEPLARVASPVAGTILLGPLPPGNVRVEILAPGHGLAVFDALPIEKAAIAEANASLSSPTDFFSVEVVDAFGLPVAGARVELQAADLWTSLPYTHGLTDGNGRHCFEGVPHRVNVRVSRPQMLGSELMPSKIYCGQASSGTTMRVVLE